MNDHSDSAMIALVPTAAEWCHMDTPHLTIVYTGKIEGLPSTLQNEMAKEALNIAKAVGPQILDVLRPDIFGDDEEKVDVVRFMPSPELLLMRRAVERWNASEHKDFNPHITVGPVGSLEGELPTRVLFDKIGVWWGTTAYIFKLTGR